jgi:tetratricopeptide (TPR) repeat protein
MEGKFDEGVDLVARGILTEREAGLLVSAAGRAQQFAFIGRRSGDLVAAELLLRESFEELERLGDRAFQSTLALELAEVLHLQGKAADEVRALCDLARERSFPEDLVNFVYLDALEARILARDGRADDAERHARHALELAETTDFFAIRGMRARLPLVEVLLLRGREDEARQLATEAVALHDAKGDVTGVAAIRRHLRELDVGIG